MCQITTKKIVNDDAILLKNEDFKSGSLSSDSYIHPEKIHTIDGRIIRYKVGSLKLEKINEVMGKLREMFN